MKASILLEILQESIDKNENYEVNVNIILQNGERKEINQIWLYDRNITLEVK